MDEPMPRDFGWRWVLWMAWCNAISILATLQAVFAAITLDPTLLPHDVVHWIQIASLILLVIIAQLKKYNPPPPLLKDPS
jgi:hypothetical protein